MQIRHTGREGREEPLSLAKVRLPLGSKTPASLTAGARWGLLVNPTPGAPSSLRGDTRGRVTRECPGTTCCPAPVPPLPRRGPRGVAAQLGSFPSILFLPTHTIPCHPARLRAARQVGGQAGLRWGSAELPPSLPSAHPTGRGREWGEKGKFLLSASAGGSERGGERFPGTGGGRCQQLLWVEGLRGELNESESAPWGVRLDISGGVGGLSLAYSSVRTSQSCRLIICLARREPIVIMCNCGRKTVQETPKFWCKLRHAVGSGADKNKPRVRLQASTEQPETELAQHPAVLSTAQSQRARKPLAALTPLR